MSRIKITLLLAVSILLGFNSSLKSQSTSKTIKATVEVTYAEFLGSTPELRDILPVPATDHEKLERAELMKQAPTNFIGREKHAILRPDLAFKGDDPVWQKEILQSKADVIEPTVNIDGLYDAFGSPHDPTGDIGKDNYVQAVNATTIGVYSKTGVLQTSFPANTLWSSIGYTSAGDPIVLYDQEANRWIITEFPNGNKLLVAVSNTSDPMGSWKAWAFSTPNFPDYPKYGVWNNCYSVTTNEDGPGTLSAYFIKRDALLSGAASVPIQRITVPGNSNTTAGFFVASPVDWSGAMPPSSDPMLVRLNDSSWGGTPTDAIEVYSVNINWTTPANTVVTNTVVPTAPYDAYACAAPGSGFACVPQKGGGGLDGIPEVIMNQVHYRNFGTHESMVMNFMTDVNGNELSGVRWIEMRKTTGTDWTVYQEGTYAPDDGLHRFMGGIAMDGAGNIALGYNVSNSTNYVGVRVTGRRASDPLGQMTVPEYTVANGVNTINSGGRFGDYAQMTIDPTNDRTFWYTTEYAKGGSGKSRTRIVAFELRRDSNDIGPLTLVKPVDTDSLNAAEPIQVAIKNFGIDTQFTFQVGYLFPNSAPVIEDVTYTLPADSVYIHTFASTIDLSVIGHYNYKVFTTLPGDQAILNDTLRGVVSKLPKFDAGISNITGTDAPICGESAAAGFVLTNYGTQTLNALTITISLNGTVFQTLNWTGVLVSGANQEIPVTLTGLLDGTNNLTVTTSNPNGQIDENTTNDSNQRDLSVVLGGGTISLLLHTDNYPEETSWNLTNANGVVLYSGGPYSLGDNTYTESLCLDPDECYVFTITDSFGDGICCGEGNGNYSIVDANNNPLATGSGEFGFSESNNFCATFHCMMTADIAVSPETAVGAGNGTIMITPANGVGPYQYSIDGGVTFQSTNIFTNLSAGEYAIVVKGGFDCSYEGTAKLIACSIDFTATVINASNNTNNGKITIVATNGVTPYRYSKNGGVTYQLSSTFSNLAAGTYNIVVKDANGCTTSQQIVVSIVSGESEVVYGQAIQVYPNPTSGIFSMQVDGLEHHGLFLRIGIYDANGKMLYESNLTKFNETYKGTVSLNTYPSGVYYVRFIDSSLKRLVRVVKE